jgi:hypothetical protein
VKEIIGKLRAKEEFQRASFTGQDRNGRRLARVEKRTFENKIAILKNIK